MVKVYIRNNEVQDGNGTTITRDADAVRAASQGVISETLRAAMRSAGLRPALGEEVACEIIHPDGQRQGISLQAA